MLRGIGATSGAAASIVIGTTTVTGGTPYAILREDGSANLAADSTLTFGGSIAGQGLIVNAGTASSTNVPLATFSRVNSNAAIVRGFEIAFTDTTSSAGFLPFLISGTATGAVNLFSVDKIGSGVFAGSVSIGSGNAFQVFNGANRTGFFVGGGSAALRLASGGVATWTNSATDANTTVDTSLSRGGAANTVACGNGTAGNASGTLQLTNLVTTATSSTGTAAIIDASNVLRPLTSSRAFKSNISKWRDDKKVAAFLGISSSTFDYEDHTRESYIDGMIIRSKGEDRDGIKGVLGFIAEDLNDAGLTEMLNYDADGNPYSLREHAVMAYLHAALKNHETRLAKAGY